MKKKNVSLIKKIHADKYPLGHSKMTALSIPKNPKLKASFAASDFHQSESIQVGQFYKPSAFLFNESK